MKKDTHPFVLLFDFYGELLTEKQREVFDLYYNEDLSLAEIAEGAGISRQGVRDNIVRAEKALTEIEEKTGLVERFVAYGRDAKRLGEIARAIREHDEALAPLAQELESIAHRLKE